MATEEKLTLRQAAYRFGVFRSDFVGSPETIANEIERWFVGRAADGFNLRVTWPKDFPLFHVPTGSVSKVCSGKRVAEVQDYWKKFFGIEGEFSARQPYFDELFDDGEVRAIAGWRSR